MQNPKDIHLSFYLGNYIWRQNRKLYFIYWYPKYLIKKRELEWNVFQERRNTSTIPATRLESVINLQASPGLCLASPHLSNLTGVRGQPRGLLSTNERPELSGGEQCRGRLVASSGPMQAVNFTIWDTDRRNKRTQTGGQKEENSDRVTQTRGHRQKKSDKNTLTGEHRQVYTDRREHRQEYADRKTQTGDTGKNTQTGGHRQRHRQEYTDRRIRQTHPQCRLLCTYCFIRHKNLRAFILLYEFCPLCYFFLVKSRHDDLHR